MIRVERICRSNPMTIASLSSKNDIVEKLEDRLNDIVRNGGRIMQILEVGDNYTTEHFTVVYEDRRGRA